MSGSASLELFLLKIKTEENLHLEALTVWLGKGVTGLLGEEGYCAACYLFILCHTHPFFCPRQVSCSPSRSPRAQQWSPSLPYLEKTFGVVVCATEKVSVCALQTTRDDKERDFSGCVIKTVAFKGEK